MRIALIILLTFMSIVSNATASAKDNELWEAWLNIREYKLQFKLSISPDKKITLLCGGESISLDESVWQNDSLFIKMPVFDSEFKIKITGNIMNGVWINNYRKTLNRIPFYAVKNNGGSMPVKATVSVAGKWKTTFSPGTKDENMALGIFEQKGNELTGTFLTPTGDYRFLEGKVAGNTFTLSAFDGSHAFLFTGTVTNDSIKGKFFSGIHWEEPYVAQKNEKYTLPDPNALTFLKEGYTAFDFSFPDINGNMVSIKDKRFEGKPVIVQLMGSWCPNCMDETKYLAEQYKKFNKKGLEIVALAFERTPEPDRLKININRLISRYDVQYPILIAGTSSKTEASEKLPMLNAVMAFPTTIYIDKNGKVRKIYTGFNGPATGAVYEKFSDDFIKLVNKMIEE